MKRSPELKKQQFAATVILALVDFGFAGFLFAYQPFGQWQSWLFGGLVCVALPFVIWQSVRGPTEEELIARQDRAMKNVRDDPDEPARWVP